MLISDANQATFQGSPCHREPCHPRPGSIGLEPTVSWPTQAMHYYILPKNNSSPLKIGRAPRGNDRIPSIHFQVQTVSESKGNPSKLQFALVVTLAQNNLPPHTFPRHLNKKRGQSSIPFCGSLFFVCGSLRFWIIFWGGICSLGYS